MTAESTGFLRLGAGTFAGIYVLGGRNGVALKYVHDPSRCPELLAEFDYHKSVYEKCKGLAFKIPQPLEYYPSTSKLNQDLWLEVDEPESVARDLHTMERIWPVPADLSASIRAAFFPEKEKGYDRAFICRIYLGKEIESDVPKLFFNANNFPLDAARCKHLNSVLQSEGCTHLNLPELAADMGKTLSRIHFCAGFDGRDIEFVLAGKHLSLTQFDFYCLDFNQMKPHTGQVDVLVSAFIDNDKYYPRPGMQYWDEFKGAYLKEAAAPTSGASASHIAEQVILRIEASKQANEPPEGRGNEMADLVR